jgi:protein subunit release factor B
MQLKSNLFKKVRYAGLSKKYYIFFFTRFFFTTQIKNPVSSMKSISRRDIKLMLDNKSNIELKKVKSSGPGGQHVNKTQSAVMMREKNTNIYVKVGNSRDSIVNAGIAKKRLLDKLDQYYNGDDSKIEKKYEKIRKQKDRQRRKSELKSSEKNTKT